jgi:hypothetical protein
MYSASGMAAQRVEGRPPAGLAALVDCAQRHELFECGFDSVAATGFRIVRWDGRSMNASEGSNESPLTPLWLGDPRPQSGITRFQSQVIKT